MSKIVTVRRLCAVLLLFDAGREATWLFSVHRRLDLHASTDSGFVGETDRWRHHGQVQVPPVGVSNQLDNHIPVGVRSGRDTRYDVGIRDG